MTPTTFADAFRRAKRAPRAPLAKRAPRAKPIAFSRSVELRKLRRQLNEERLLLKEVLAVLFLFARHQEGCAFLDGAKCNCVVANQLTQAKKRAKQRGWVW